MSNLYPILCSLLVLFSLQACSGGEDTDNTNTDTTQDSSTVATVSKDTLHSIKLVFAGDIMGHGSQIKSAYNEKTKKFDYEPCFRYIEPILKNADLAIGNLELTLNDKNRYTGYPRFRSPDTLAHFLKRAGFNFLVTANNHSNDNNLYGLTHTLDVLDALEIPHTGTFRNQQERVETYPHLMLKEVDGTTFKLVFLNYTYGTNGIDTKEPSIVNLIDKKQMVKDVERAKAMEPDMIIAVMHWGSEYKLDERSYQQTHAQLLWENGVDVVIGAHPHVIQPVKTSQMEDTLAGKTRDLVVAYSLGNFISNMYKKNTDIGLMFELELEKNTNTGHTYVKNHDYIFTWCHIHNKSNSSSASNWTHMVIPSTVLENDSLNFFEMSRWQRKRMEQTTSDMREHMAKWQSQERQIAFDDVVKPGEVFVTKKKENELTQ